MKPVRYLVSTLAVVFLALLFMATAGAQENATISGSVTDPTGAAVPNATVTITQTATGTSRTAQSNGAGLFTFPGLAIGTYRLRVVANGFKTYEKSGLVLNVGQTLVAPAKLQVGSAAQTVTVTANALQVQSQTNAITTLITGKQILQLATNGRSVTELTTLGTGVTTNMPSFNGVTAQGANANIDFNGIRSDHNIWMIDGGEVYDRGSGGKLDVAISPDALAQFQILSSNYTPDFGIGSGGTILMVLKSGTRHFHGGLWEINRNDDFDAQNYFTKQAHQATPELRLNIFGGNIGGPVFIPHVYNNSRNKTFFFVNEEWRRLVQGANPSTVNTIPEPFFPTAGQPLAYTPLSGNPLIVPMTEDPAKLATYAGDGLVAGQPFPQNSSGQYVIPANLIDPNAVLFMNSGAIPKPNFNGSQVISSPKQPTSVREDVVRIDQNFNSKYQLMGHWVHDTMSQTIFPVMWSGDSYNTVGDVFNNPTWSAVVSLTQALSPTLLNVTSLDTNGNQINVTPTGIYQEPSGWTAQGLFSGNNALNRMPQISFSGAPNTTYTVIYWPWHNAYLNYQLRDDLSVTKGKHAMKFGFSYMREDKNQQLQADTEGDYSFADSAYTHDAYANFLLGFASNYDQLQTLTTPHWVDNTYSFYLMDNWHMTPRLTVNLGIRYDAMPHTYEKDGRDSNFVPADFSMANAQSPDVKTGALDPTGAGFQLVPGAPVPFYLNGMELAGVSGPRGLVNNWYKAIQPRVGFAYDLTGSGTTVLRAGAGMFFERVQGNDIYGTAVNPPYAYQPSVSGVYFSDPKVSNQSGLATTGAPFFPGSLTALNKYYPNPGTLQFSLGIQRELAPSVVAKVQYVGSSTWHQNYERAINTLPLIDPTNMANPYDNREAVASGTNSNLFRIFPGWSGITQESNGTNTSYNSLQAGIRMENKHGLTLQFDYTWSHEIDILSDDVGGNEVGGAQLSDPFNISYDKGSGTIDRRNVFNANYIYNLPFFAHSSSRMTRTLLGGWTLSGITVAESGSPTNVTYSPDDLGLGGGTTNRPNIVSKVSYPKTQKAWFSASSFAAPVAPWNGGPNEGFGTARKDSVIGPGMFNWNMSLFKSFALGEGMNIQLRAESFNTFNHTEFSGIDTGFTDSNFGQVTSANDPRTFQFGGKFSF